MDETLQNLSLCLEALERARVMKNKRAVEVLDAELDALCDELEASRADDGDDE